MAPIVATLPTLETNAGLVNKGKRGRRTLVHWRSRAVMAGITALDNRTGGGSRRGRTRERRDRAPCVPGGRCGLRVQCADRDIMAVSGAVDMVDHWTVDAQGVFHETGP